MTSTRHPTGRTGDTANSRAGRTVLLAALVFLVALNLRAALTSVGPLLDPLSRDRGLAEGMQGLLGALPLLAFAAVSPLVHRLSTRVGVERAVGIALGVLAGGVVVRSYTGTAGLWLGTAIIGAAIAVANVLVPVIVKRDYASHVSLATGAYSACLTVTAAIASATAVPLAGPLAWQGALAFWALPAVVVALAWLPRMRRPAPVAPVTEEIDPSAPSVWRQRKAWFVTAFMGLQSTTFYVMVNWLPAIERSHGISSGTAGVHLLLLQISGVLAGFGVSRLLRRPHSQVGAAVFATVPTIVGTLGLLVAPGAALLWAIVLGMGPGASLVVALTLIGLRGGTHHGTTKLSGMAQSMGYLFAAGGPVSAGFLAQHTGSWTASLVLVAALGVVQLVVAVPAGRP